MALTILKVVENILSKQDTILFTTHEIKDLAYKIESINKSSVIPSDYCYNRTNAGIDKSGALKDKFLVYINQGNFEYVGYNYPYSGKVYHRPQKKSITYIVGEWVDGTYYSDFQNSNDTESLSNKHKFIEGSIKRISVNAYERNPKARQACLSHFGAVCSVCSFDFEAVYGELGKGFIHVHHLNPLAEIGTNYVIDPLNDLIPLCPNCHAMVHRKIPPVSPEKLRMILNKNT